MDQLTQLVVEGIDRALNGKLAAKIDADGFPFGYKEKYSCCAVYKGIDTALNKKYPNTDWGHIDASLYSTEYVVPISGKLEIRKKESAQAKKIFRKLARKAGCPVSSVRAYESLPVKQRQVARALWLTTLRHAIVEGLI